MIHVNIFLRCIKTIIVSVLKRYHLFSQLVSLSFISLLNLAFQWKENKLIWKMFKLIHEIEFIPPKSIVNYSVMMMMMMRGLCVLLHKLCICFRGSKSVEMFLRIHKCWCCTVQWAAVWAAEPEDRWVGLSCVQWISLLLAVHVGALADKVEKLKVA